MSELRSNVANDLAQAYERAACGLLTTADDGAILRANATIRDWLGLPEAELLGRRFSSLLTMGSRLFHQTHWSPLLQMQGSVAEVQLELVHRDGRVLPVLVNAAKRSLRDPRSDVEIAIFVAADRRKYERELLAARRRAEEALERAHQAEVAQTLAEARLRLALESASLSIWSADPDSGARRYEPGVAKLLGRPADEPITAEIFLAHMRAADRERDAEALRAALDPAQRRTYALEFALAGADGEERIVRSRGQAFFDGAGRPLQFSGVLEDITARCRAEQALQQRENAFRTLAENSPDIILRFDRERRVVFAGPAIRAVSPRPLAELLGGTLAELRMDGGLCDVWARGLDEAFAARPLTLAGTYLTPEGRRRQLQTHFVPEHGTRGDIVSALVLAHDVTALREQELEAERRAELAEQFVGIVSHDLRNPLNAVALGANLLTQVGPEDHTWIVNRIVASTERASRLIADLLDFTQARLGGGLRVTPKELDWHAVVADALEEVGIAGKSGAIVHRRVREGSGQADADRITQVVTNLVNNALVYGLPGEPVTVTSSVFAERLELRVHNRGAPIPEALRAEIFEPLQRGEREVQRGSRSVGLGLYIVRQIAVAHGGAVAVESSADEGTTFVVSLPRGRP